MAAEVLDYIDEKIKRAIKPFEVLRGFPHYMKVFYAKGDSDGVVRLFEIYSTWLKGFLDEDTSSSVAKRDLKSFSIALDHVNEGYDSSEILVSLNEVMREGGPITAFFRKGLEGVL